MRVRRSNASGAFHAASFATRLSFRYREWQNILEKFGDPLSSDNIDWGRCEGRERQLILTHFHERDHLAFFSSSPLGLLVWRSHQILSIGVRFFCRKFEEAGTSRFYGRLSDWYKEVGFEELQRSILEGDAAPEVVREYGRARAAEISHDKMLNLCEEWDSIEKLLDILTGDILTRDSRRLRRYHDWTLRDFAKLAQKAYKWLCVRSDIPVTFEWIPSRNASNYDTPLFPEDARFNALNIYEAAARFNEVQQFPHFRNVTEEYKEYWHKNYIYGMYKPAFDAVGGINTDPFVARMYLGMSCGTPLDPATIQPGTTIAADEVLPWFRLRMLQNHLQVERTNTREGPGTLWVGLPRILTNLRDEMMAPLAQALDVGFLGPNARWSFSSPLFRLQASPLIQLEHFLLDGRTRALEMVLSEFERRFAEKLQRWQTGDADVSIFDPKLVVYDDLIRPTPGDRFEGMYLHRMLAYNALVDTYAISLLKDEFVDSITVVRDRITAGVRQVIEAEGGEFDERSSMSNEFIFSDEMPKRDFGTVGMNTFVYVADSNKNVS